MGRLIYCAETEAGVIGYIAGCSFDNIFKDLVGIINTYNHAVESHNYWMNTKIFSSPKDNKQEFHNAIAKAAQNSGDTIYSQSMKKAAFQIDVIKRYVENAAESLDDVTKRRVIKKLNTRLSKMIK